MRILVIGAGGREHAIVWKLKQSPKVTELYCAPGNGGIAQLATCIPISELHFAELTQFAVEKQIDLTVVGPDNPLSEGIVDYFEAKGLKVYGPRKNAAIIEASKSFSKDLMRKYNIPTAEYGTFTDYDAALVYVKQKGAPIVIKANGLALGKGVVVAMTLAEAEQALQEMMLDKTFGTAGDSVVIEQFLTGQELSLLSFVDGEMVRPMVSSQDHKAVFDGDKGPNTGGMGTYSPVPQFSQQDIELAVETIVKPAARAMVQEGRPFRGVLYAGLMMTEQGPKVIEFNARFGDPETQVILPRLKSDLLDIILASIEGTLTEVEIEWSEQAAVCVILASEGYPGSYPKGLPIEGLEQAGEAIVFHAGTAVSEGQIVTNGGRVLGITGLGRDIAEAREAAYAAAKKIQFKGAHYRSDIAKKALTSWD